MAIDLVSACEDSANGSTPQLAFILLACIFATYIAIDTVLFSILIFVRVREHNSSEDTNAASLNQNPSATVNVSGFSLSNKNG